jgi:hypothetical protein
MVWTEVYTENICDGSFAEAIQRGKVLTNPEIWKAGFSGTFPQDGFCKRPAPESRHGSVITNEAAVHPLRGWNLVNSVLAVAEETVTVVHGGTLLVDLLDGRVNGDTYYEGTTRYSMEFIKEVSTL